MEFNKIDKKMIDTEFVQEINEKAPLSSPSFKGTPTAPTPPTNDNSEQIATTAFVHETIENNIPGDLKDHLDDSDIHVTASERISWAAKETPQGSQLKVNNHAATVATTSTAGHVKPDGKSITIDNNGIISAKKEGVTLEVLEETPSNLEGKGVILKKLGNGNSNAPDKPTIQDVYDRLENFTLDLLQSNNKTAGFIHINEYKHLVPNTAISRNDWDWTAAFKKAAVDASSQGKSVYLNKEVYSITDSFLDDVATKSTIHWKGHMSIVNFVNTTVDKPVINLKPHTSHSTFENICFYDINKGTSMGVRISAYPQANGQPNWKNRFIGCQFYNFKTGVNFTTNGDPLVGSLQDWSSENLFLHCKIRNCTISILNQNLQALNNSFIQTDIENDIESEQYTIIRDEAGGGMYFSHCSIIGRGRVYEWCYPKNGTGLFPGSHIYITNCRFEVRPTHIGELFYQDPNGAYNGFSRVSINITDCTFTLFAQSVDLIKYVGKVNANFTNLNVSNGTFNVRNIPVPGVSATIEGGSLGKVVVTNTTSVFYILDTTITEYGTPNSRYAGHVSINVNNDTSSTMTTDTLGFQQMKNYSVEQLPYGLSHAQPKQLVFNDPSPTSGFKHHKLILPKYARLMKFGYWKQPVRFSEDTRFKLYLVKDAANWATQGTLTLATDAFLVADTGSTINKSGLFEVPIQLTNNELGNNMTSGFGSGWREGRVYIEFSGTSYAGGFLFIEYM